MQMNPKLEKECTEELMAWESYCWSELKAGHILPTDPFYEYNDRLTPDVIEAVIRQHEDNLKYEISHYPVYHIEAQGFTEMKREPHDVLQAFLRPTNWDKLPYDQQFAIVQGMHRVMSKYRMTDNDFEAARQEAIRKQEERDANLARDPHFYDAETAYYGC